MLAGHERRGLAVLGDRRFPIHPAASREDIYAHEIYRYI